MSSKAVVGGMSNTNATYFLVHGFHFIHRPCLIYMLLKDLQKTELCVFAQCKKLFRINGAEMLKPVCLNHVHKKSCFHKKSYCWYEKTCYNTWL